VSTENPAGDVRKGEELDIAAIDAVLKANVPGLEGNPDVKQFSSGASNLTYALTYPNRSLVLRRPPFGTRPKRYAPGIPDYHGAETCLSSRTQFGFLHRR